MSEFRIKVSRSLSGQVDEADLISRVAFAGAGADIALIFSGDGPVGGGCFVPPQYLDPGIENDLEKIRVSYSSSRHRSFDATLVASPEEVVFPGRQFVAEPRSKAEGMHLSRLRYALEVANHSSIRQESSSKCGDFLKQWSGYKKSYLIATGPSFGKYKEFSDFDDSFVVTCNSAVINDEFMANVPVDLLVFGDPIFHFGPSRYAATFRESLRRVSRLHPFKIAVSEKYYFLFLHAFPELLDRTIFVPTERDREMYNRDLSRDFAVKATQNILTLLMLPFGAAVSKNIKLMGCDGRRLEDDGYFWGHNPTAQINEEMGNIQEAHPGFFSVDYNDYYLKHCADLEQFFGELELDGFTIESVAPSFIPALGKRSVLSGDDGRWDYATEGAMMSPDKRKAEFFCRRSSLKGTSPEFVSINPSLRNRKGHALYQDLAMAGALGCVPGTGFLSLGSIDCEGDLCEDFVIPAFRTSIWKVHRCSGRMRKERARRFANELLDALQALEEAVSLSETKLFFYLGHPAVLFELLLQWKNRGIKCERFVFNLFSGFYDGADLASEKEVLSSVNLLLRLSEGCEGISVVCDSELFARDVYEETGAVLPFLPMCPSQAIDSGDEGGRELGKPLRIAFPSQAEEIRGYGLLVDFVRRYGKRFSASLRFSVRAYTVKGNRSAFFPKRANVTVIEGSLNDREYSELIAHSDAVLLPYQPDTFRYRTSSILAEAFSCGVPVIATRDTWMEKQIESTGGGWIIPEWSADGFAEAFDEVLETLDAQRLESMRAGMRKWLEDNNIENFVEKILQPGTSKAVETGEEVITGCSAVLYCSEKGRGGPQGPRRRIDVLAVLRRTLPQNVKTLGRGTIRFLRRSQILKRLRKSKFRMDGDSVQSGLELGKYFLNKKKLGKRVRILLDGDLGKVPAHLAKEKVSFSSVSQFMAAPVAKQSCLSMQNAGEVINPLFIHEEVPEPGQIKEAFSSLHRSGYQVWVFQFHPPSEKAEKASLYRVFPYPSFPVCGRGALMVLALPVFIDHEAFYAEVVSSMS